MTLGGPLSGLNGQMDIVKPGLVPKTTVWFRKREIPFFRSRENTSDPLGFQINRFRINEASLLM